VQARRGCRGVEVGAELRKRPDDAGRSAEEILHGRLDLERIPFVCGPERVRVVRSDGVVYDSRDGVVHCARV
jgi:hypothetical protein